MAWVRDYKNGLHKNQLANEFVFDLQYQPAEYVLLLRGQNELDPVARMEALKEISSIQHYTLTLSTTSNTDLVEFGVQTLAEKQHKEYYFSYLFQNDISLEEDGKVLPCVLYHFEKHSDKNEGRTFVLGFENNNRAATEAKVTIRSEMLSSLPIKIKVLKSDIPNLDL